LRRPRRSIETFDIALMAVVTKAMGAFLVLMLIMLPSYNKVPGMQQEVHDADAALQRLTQRVEALQERNDVLRQRSGAASGGTVVSLLLTFSYADCPSGLFSFYARGENVTLADGSDWPPVHSGEQDAPPEVVAYIGAKAPWIMRQNPLRSVRRLSALTVQFVNGLGLIPPPDWDFSDRAKDQVLWLINDLRPGAKFALYVKPLNTVRGCAPIVGALVPEASVTNAESPQWNRWFLLPKDVDRIVHLGYVVWTGRGLETLDPTAADQAELDAQVEKERAEKSKNSDRAR
jgi:hypothetical protein